MDKPKVYFLMVRCGWNWVDSLVKWQAVDPALRQLEARGYQVVEKKGVSVNEFNAILKRRDTYGVIVAGGHGGPVVQLDPEGKDLSCPQGAANIETLKADPQTTMPHRLITDEPNPGLGFVLFHACDISRGTLDGYLKRLRKTAKGVDVYGWPGANLYTLIGLDRAIKKICESLPFAGSAALESVEMTAPLARAEARPVEHAGLLHPASIPLAPRVRRPREPAPVAPRVGSLRWMAQGLGTTLAPSRASLRPTPPPPFSLRWMAQGLSSSPIVRPVASPQVPPPWGSLRSMAQGLGPAPAFSRVSLRPTPSTLAPPGSLRWIGQGLGPAPAPSRVSLRPTPSTLAPPGSLRWIGQGLGPAPAPSRVALRPTFSTLAPPGSLRWIGQGLGR